MPIHPTGWLGETHQWNSTTTVWFRVTSAISLNFTLKMHDLAHDLAVHSSVRNAYPAASSTDMTSSMQNSLNLYFSIENRRCFHRVSFTMNTTRGISILRYVTSENSSRTLTLCSVPCYICSFNLFNTWKCMIWHLTWPSLLHAQSNSTGFEAHNSRWLLLGCVSHLQFQFNSIWKCMIWHTTW